eukprot:CAMPEP_0180512798 /NCGR_PEP_ID=MMETSP1036_2-20121128/51792_1 /TAXON_ID=632150 /ORGANISM="Azadinium spinosum, Strain 3D9" /LENGTH=97 /DNA_ID=CAMNT_0022523985 /DNA_START=31 /DNA_END=324 /DNA_ORIENTATION=-
MKAAISSALDALQSVVTHCFRNASTAFASTFGAKINRLGLLNALVVLPALPSSTKQCFSGMQELRQLKARLHACLKASSRVNPQPYGFAASSSGSWA